MRTLFVITPAKVTVRQIRLLPVTWLPGTLAQLLPVQYSTSKLCTTYCLPVIVGVGSTELEKPLSCTENTATSLMNLFPLKSICTQSGYSQLVLSPHTPP